MKRIELTVNLQARTVELPAERLLVVILRDDFALTGTKIGCGTGDCGACTVMLNGSPVTSCLVYGAECSGDSVETIEHVATTPLGKAVVGSFVDAGAVQCGICTPGFVVAATNLLATTYGPLSRSAIGEALAGNLCRCTGYYPIIKALQMLADDGAVAYLRTAS
jgi:aerobic-type carbon monoxide dehydrogenase small subunit (CoxS/CutS family)